jgi:Zn-dependent M28 family amino/carboxypeptidase
MRSVLATMVLLAGCREVPPPPREFDGAAALRYVESQLGFGPRVPGVAILLGMADALRKAPPEVGVDLLFVDGEDYGSFDAGQDQDVLIGSRYYAAHLPAGPLPRYAVLFDMVGDRDLRILREGSSVTGAPDVVEMVWAVAERIGHGALFAAEDTGPITDDHVPLQQVGIRAIDLIDLDYGPGNGWHHTPDDTIDKLSGASLQAVGDVGMALVREAKP